MDLIVLFFRMLRYRVAILLLVFYVFGIVVDHKLNMDLALIYGVIVLTFSYVVATTLNDIADKKIDKINHPNSPGRPLATGKADKKSVIKVSLFSCFFALLFSLLINVNAFLVAISYILIGYAYSLPPFKISYRTYLAPLLLSIAYVCLPYLLGKTLTKNNLNMIDWALLLAFSSMYYGRILLKDFRDRKGDAKYGKPTFLLKHGKKLTLIYSAAFIIIGDVVLLSAFTSYDLVSLLLVQPLFITIVLALAEIYRSKDYAREAKYIGLGAKAGYGIFLGIMTFFILKQSEVNIEQIRIIIILIILLYLYTYFKLSKNENSIVIGYKG